MTVHNFDDAEVVFETKSVTIEVIIDDFRESEKTSIVLVERLATVAAIYTCRMC